MTTRSFPSDPCSRKALIVLSQHDIERCAYEPGASKKLLDEEVFIVQFPVHISENMPKALRNINDNGLARPGCILVQSPYDHDTYEDASQAPQRFALAKHMYFSTLCMHLGAKEVSVEQVELHTQSGKSSLDVKGDRVGGSAQLTVENEQLENFRSQMHLRDEFAGGRPDVAAAESLLRSTGLWQDPNMRSLLEMRKDGVNQLTTRKLVLNLSSEANSNLNVAGRLNMPAFVKLSAEYARVLKDQSSYTLTVLVRF